MAGEDAEGAGAVVIYALRQHQMLHMGHCACGRWRSGDGAAPREVHRQFMTHRAAEVVSFLKQSGHIPGTGEDQWGYQYKAARPDAAWGPIGACRDRADAETAVKQFRAEVGDSGAVARLTVRCIGDWTPVVEAASHGD